jgi:hypothetical protein
MIRLVAGVRRGEFSVPASARERIEYRTAAGEFEEWLTQGQIPDVAIDRPQVSVESPEELVDVAVDSNRRVIEDRDRGYCAVLGDEATYVYELPEPVVDSPDDQTGSSTDTNPLDCESVPANENKTLLAQLRAAIGSQEEGSDRPELSGHSETTSDEPSTETNEGSDPEPAHPQGIDDDRSS